MAFDQNIRGQIRRRANNVSEVTGLNTQPMQAAHLDHTRNENYNSLDNGLYLRLEEHMWQHLSYRGKAELTGLSEQHNENAISALFSQLMIWKFRHGDISLSEILAVVPDYQERYPWEFSES